MSGIHGSAGGSVLLSVVDGQLVVSGHGTPAQLAWGDHVHVLRNGVELVGHSCAVMGRDRIEVVIDQQPGSVDYSVDTADRRLKALLRVDRTPSLHRSLADAALSPRLELVVVESDTGESMPTLEEALASIAAAGVTVDAHAEAVADAVARPGSVSVVASGTPAVPPIDATIEMVVDLDSVRASGVPAGSLLARRIPPVPGTAGSDVFGQPIEPEMPRDAAMSVGDGARSSEDGLLIFAAVDGWPTFDGEVVSVMAERIVAALDHSTGPLHAWGNLVVSGNVEGVTVQVSGRMVVQGTVDHSSIICGRGLDVRGSSMSATMRAGHDPHGLREALHLLAPLLDALERLHRHVEELRMAAAEREQDLPFGVAVQLVATEVEPETLDALLAAADALHRMASSGAVRARDARAMHTVAWHDPAKLHDWHDSIQGAGACGMEPWELAGVQSELAALVQRLDLDVHEPACMQVAGTQSSHLEAGGRVTVVGTGMFSTHVIAHGGFTATSESTVIRGGSIESDGQVSVAELGSPRGATTSIELRETGTLVAAHVHPGTMVRSNGQEHWFLEERTHVKAGPGTDGISVESLAA